LSDDSPCFHAQNDLLSFTLAVGFPGSFLAMFSVLGLFSRALRPSDFSFLWWAGFIAGYVQWFVVLPRMLQPTKTLTLGLSRLRRAPIPLSLGLNSSNAAATSQEKPELRTATLAQFDSKGRTPLERALAGTKLRS
jgi:hypothetical protein